MLNNRYGSCNFTSFVRYIVPLSYEQRYLAFVKYQRENVLSAETNGLVDRLLEEEEIKEERIRNWWERTDREISFRSYCMPGSKGIRND